MNIKVEYWNDEDSKSYSKWCDTVGEAMTFVNSIKKFKVITSITVSQILYEYESE